MGLQELLEKYGTGEMSMKNWFKLKEEEKTRCEGCMFDIGCKKYCLIYLEESAKEKPQNCSHRREFKEGR